MTRPSTCAEIRQSFLEFFRDRGHEIVPSAPVIPGDDPTLYFTNAGMNQFKDVFLGTGQRSYTRAVDTQKCMRVSGKHNDLEDVGKDHYHHTLFEMLGNWSFGDYYKEDTIRWAWELLTEAWGIPKERLHATVFTDDDEAYEIWKKYVVDESHITRHGHKDNFWEMGATGPCGPSTEIHYDLGEEFTSVENPGPNLDDVRFREVWNLVFIQYERLKDGSLQPLTSKHVDTGLGLERVVAILQGTESHYDTDVFTPYIQWVAKESGVPYDRGEGGIPHRVIADHLRAVSFTIADGVIPSNEHRGYVVRRILRRAARYGKQLGLNEPFLFRLVPLLIENLGAAFPELIQRQDHITEVIRSEEERFSAALDRGMRIFEEEATKLLKMGQKTVPGETVFTLYDTHGFPMDLTRLLAEERGLSIEEERFEQLREEAKEKTREASKQFQADDGSRRCAEGLPATKFVGYEALETSAKVLRTLPCETPGEIYLTLDRTPCYAESGGQVSDGGFFLAEGFRGELIHCSKEGDVFLHRIRVLEGSLADGDKIQVEVDRSLRLRSACNHTATHLLQAALQKVVGDHVTQAGSLVGPNRLRFDFVHSGPLTAEEISQVEGLVLEQIQHNIPLQIAVMDRAEADSKGAMALFGEKYGDKVRVVEVPGFSTELCGGTHVEQTGAIQGFRLLSQASVAANVRRVECLAGPALLDHLQDKAALVEEISNELGCPAEDLPARVAGLLKEIKKLRKDLQAARKRGASLSPDQLAKDALEIAGKGFSFASGFAEGLTVPDLRDLTDVVLQKLGGGVVLLATCNEEKNKVQLVCKVDPALSKQGVHAGKLIKEVAQITGGKGGGRPEMATAGGSDVSKIPEALERARELLQGT
jgi:alanyl-tRNA synthetase